MNASDVPDRNVSEDIAPKVGAAPADPAALEQPAPLTPKVDPESLVLRGSPRRVVRFRRELIIGMAAVGALAIAATAWIALSPASFKLAASGDEMFDAQAARSPEALAAAPGSYDAIPKLGSPLPGDLGRPILEHQRKLAGEGEVLPADPAADAAAVAREKALADQAAARQSAVLMLGGRSGAANLTVADTVSAPEKPGETVPGAPASAAATGSAVAASANEVSAHRIRQPASPWIVSSGSIIPANLVTGLDSDLPGLVVAQVSENVYDSITGRTLLIPQGARLLGRYESNIAFGQRRAFVAWQRIIWPDGSSLTLDNAPATDAAGYAGLADQVDFHSWALLKGVGLATLLGVGTELGFGNDESELVRAMRESAQTNGARAGDRIVERNLDIPPTIRVRPGWTLRVIVHRDLVLAPWRP
ncbi:Conjugal transfer protein trbI [Sphingobium herbicidovorans NBRC 16415]|uniref:Conjugal transfer protein trbI n=1 Tax=Sphingobium herbicidovorans (strain ATCC 700291 / DSM 11019 / CCUG 56400 / KCTC 2939 / LMG 18315 / NBRC 16415 / MH) TaxID=1219045 RepID=A0A086P5I6_SPHHM|nr:MULTISPECIES: TrbI/VirB10 family protein [Sphingomonadaceae]KFG88654.1 Conjugal transfer protein trbI [Sphingobium herbicidovorans NBRC 16415]